VYLAVCTATTHYSMCTLLCALHLHTTVRVPCCVRFTYTLQYVYLAVCTAPTHYSMCTLVWQNIKYIHGGNSALINVLLQYMGWTKVLSRTPVFPQGAQIHILTDVSTGCPNCTSNNTIAITMCGPFTAIYLPLSVLCIDISSKTPSLGHSPCSRGLSKACVYTVQNWQCRRIASKCCGHKYRNLHVHCHKGNGADTIRRNHFMGLHFHSDILRHNYVLALSILSDTHRERTWR